MISKKRLLITCAIITAVLFITAGTIRSTIFTHRIDTMPKLRTPPLSRTALQQPLSRHGQHTRASLKSVTQQLALRSSFVPPLAIVIKDFCARFGGATSFKSRSDCSDCSYRSNCHDNAYIHTYPFGNRRVTLLFRAVPRLEPSIAEAMRGAPSLTCHSQNALQGYQAATIGDCVF